MRERFQDANALADISRRLREQAAAGVAAAAPAGPSGREPERRSQAAPPPRRLDAATAAARPAPPPARPPPRKRPPTAPPAPQPLPPPEPWTPADTAALVDEHLAPVIACRASADAASVQAALVAVLASGRPLPCAVRAALEAAVAALGRSCPATLPFVAAQGAADLLASAGGGLQPTTPPRPPANAPGARLAAHETAFAAGIAALRKGGADAGLLSMALAAVAGGLEEGA